MRSSLAYLFVGLVAVLAMGFLLRFDNGRSEGTTPAKSEPLATPRSVSKTDWKSVVQYDLKANDPRETRLTFEVDLDRGSLEGRYVSGSDEGGLYGEISTSTGITTIVLASPTNGARTFGEATTTWLGGVLTGEIQLGAFSYKLTPFSAQESILLRWKLVQETNLPKARASCEFRARWPEAMAGNGVSRSTAERINQQMQEIVFDGKDPAKMKDEYLANCQKELMELEREGFPIEDFDGSYQRSLWYTVSVSVNEAGYLGVLVHQSSYTGGAHGLTGRTGLFFDTHTGNRLLLRDLVPAESLDAFWRKQSRTLLAGYRDQLFEDAVSEIEAQANNKRLMATSTALLTYGGKDHFFVTPKSITFFYQPYEISPYAVGIPEARIAFTEWVEWDRAFRLPRAENEDK